LVAAAKFWLLHQNFGCSSKILVAATKNLFVVSNFVTVTKPFFSVRRFI